MTRAIVLTAALLSATASAQIDCWTTDLGANLGLGDESITPAQALGFAFVFAGTAYTDIQVCDNGYITLGASGGFASPIPDPGALAGTPLARICPFWVDLDPTPTTGGGAVYFNAIPAAGGAPAHAVITWVAVPEWNGSTPHTFQLVLVDGGGMRMSYDANLAANSNPWLVGASPGFGAPMNPVSFTTLPITTNNTSTLHEQNALGGPLPIAGQTIDWSPHGNGGYIIDQVVGCAAAVEYGSGCVGRYSSLYEWFDTTPSIDLTNTTIRLVFTGSSYIFSLGNAGFIAPTAGAANLNLSDDAETTVTLSSPLSYPGGSTTSLNVCSNGHVSVATNNAAGDFSPTPTEFLNWPHAAYAIWRDLVPGPQGGGTIWFEEIGNLSIVTYDAVLGYAGQSPGVTPSTFQFQFDRVTGEVNFVFGSLDTISVSTWAGGDGWVVGFAPGGPSLDRGNTDLSSALSGGAIVTSGQDLAPLHLAAAQPPAFNATIDLVTDHLPANAVFAGVLLGLNKFDPGINLTSFGMPGCFQFGDQLSVILFFPNGATTVSTPFAVPLYPGGTIVAQAAAFDPSAGLTPLGAIASNGVELVIGL